MIETVIIFVVVLSLLVFVHEAGHFLAARLFGIGVEEFGFGFPPRAIGWRRGGTIYSLNWIPLGGFVKLKGELNDQASPDAYLAKSKPRRLSVLAAGVVMNVVLAVLVFSIGYVFGLPRDLGNPLSPGAQVRERKLQIVALVPNKPAAAAGFKIGDEILATDGAVMITAQDFKNRLAERAGQSIAVTFRREGKEMTAQVNPTILEETGKPGIGIGLLESGIVSYPWYLAPFAGARTTLEFGVEIFKAFGRLVASLVLTGRPGVDVSGPVGIAVLTGEVAKLGLVYLLQFVGLLSLNLAIINVLPIPALDGGRILFLLIEAVRGRAVSAKIEGMIHQVGFAVLISLVAIVTVQDILRFIK
jgi:regulator of sigma E protease